LEPPIERQPAEPEPWAPEPAEPARPAVDHAWPPTNPFERYEPPANRPSATSRHRPPAAAVPSSPPTGELDGGISIRASLRPSVRGGAAPPDPADLERSARLTDRIREEIESSRTKRMTFERFMELALYEPDLGYYRQPADRPTDAGDFLTAPETHSIFGWTIARRIEEMWAELGMPNPFWIVEYGAGAGTLGLSILEGFRRHGKKALGKAARYRPIESNPHRVADLTGRFEAAGLKDHLHLPSPTSFADLLLRGTGEGGAEPVTGVLLANEFLDALPVHRITALDGWLLELYVTWREGFVEVEAEPSTPELARRLNAEHISIEHLAEGQVAEICLGLDAWLVEAAATLERGYVLVIDYGAESTELYDPRRHAAGTLLGYRDHAVVDDPFGRVGLTDLTAHVDFTALRLLGERHGLRAAPLATQSEFLMAAGLEAELQALQADPDLVAEDYMRARSGVVRMLDPRHMGGFKVLTLEKTRPWPDTPRAGRRD
jgi:SAM-dependent MidA family methyltransferase